MVHRCGLFVPVILVPACLALIPVIRQHCCPHFFPSRPTIKCVRIFPRAFFCVVFFTFRHCFLFCCDVATKKRAVALFFLFHLFYFETCSFSFKASCSTLDTLIRAFSASIFNQLGNVTFLRTVLFSCFLRYSAKSTSTYVRTPVE